MVSASQKNYSQRQLERIHRSTADDVSFRHDALYRSGAGARSNPLLANAILQSGQLPTDESTLTWCLDYVLHSSERHEYLALTNLPRKREWFCGRIAAKEAVRRLLKSSHNLSVCSADVIVATNEQGQPFATGKWMEVVGAEPYLSISHKAGIAVAIAAHRSASRGVGIDVEIIEPKENGFETLAFLPEEITELQKSSRSKKG